MSFFDKCTLVTSLKIKVRYGIFYLEAGRCRRDETLATVSTHIHLPLHHLLTYKTLCRNRSINKSHTKVYIPKMTIVKLKQHSFEHKKNDKRTMIVQKNELIYLLSR